MDAGAQPEAGTPALDAALLLAQIADHAILALDVTGTIVSWNAGAERLTGHAAAEAVGRSVTMLYADEDCLRGVPLTLLAEARAAGRAERQGWWIRRDGSRLWADTTVTALHDPAASAASAEGSTAGSAAGSAAEPIGFAVVTRDATARKQVEDAQVSFLGSIAHDFRTPITAMKGFTELVRDAPDDQRADFLRRIDANADRLMQMMKDLIGYATQHTQHTQHAHHVQLAPQPTGTDAWPETVDLAALARDTVLTMGSQAELARVVLPTGSVPVRVDRASVERIVTNLVANALKYSDAGPVSVDVSGGEDRVRLSVSDQGRGIDPRDLATIFDEFERGRLSTPDGGTGLGLASVKRLAEEQGGRVQIQSVVGQGTVVVVELPGPAGRSGSSAASA